MVPVTEKGETELADDEIREACAMDGRREEWRRRIEIDEGEAYERSARRWREREASLNLELEYHATVHEVDEMLEERDADEVLEASIAANRESPTNVCLAMDTLAMQDELAKWDEME